MAPRLLLAGLAVLAAAGCGGGGDTAKEPPKEKLSAEAQKALDEASATDEPPDEAGEIEQLLRDRVQALERRDVDAYAATATGAQRGRDRRAARRAVQMSIEHVRLVPDELQTSGNGAKATVTMSYRVRGMSRPFLTGRRLTIRRRAGDWRVSRDVARAEPLPWEVSSFRLTRAPHIVLLTPPGVDVEPLRSGSRRPTARSGAICPPATCRAACS